MTIDLPRLRLLDSQWSEQNGQPVLVLRDRIGITSQIAVVPPVLAVLLGFFDGTRDLDGIRAAFELRTGTPIGGSSSKTSSLSWTRRCYSTARASRRRGQRLSPSSTRCQPGRCRSPDRSTRRESRTACETSRHTALTPPSTAWRTACGWSSVHTSTTSAAGLYTTRRGAELCARPRRRRSSCCSAPTTSGGSGSFTLTRQSYQTPFGTLPTDSEVVDAVVEAIGEDAAYGEEIHHRGEHSIELGSVWLSYAADGRPSRPCRCSAAPSIDWSTDRRPTRCPGWIARSRR